MSFLRDIASVQGSPCRAAGHCRPPNRRM